MKSVLAFALAAVASFAQPPDRDLSRNRPRRVALVIGNDTYTATNALSNAVNDARGMKVSLEDAGFNVQLCINATLREMDKAIADFTGTVRPGDTALFFYSGHGLQVSDQNYLIPVDFEARTAVDAKYAAYPAQRVQENLEAAGAGMQILILDACRNNPFKSWRGGSDGLAAMQAGRGTYIAFATAPGKTADDNPRGRNGLFTGALIATLRQDGLSINDVFDRVREQVAGQSRGDQIPWSTSSLIGSFYFKVTAEGSVSVERHDLSPGPPPRDLGAERELAFWNSVKDENVPALLEEYLRRYPDGEFVSIARSKLETRRAAAAARERPTIPPPVVTSDTKVFTVQTSDGVEALLSISAGGVRLAAMTGFNSSCDDLTAVSFAPLSSPNIKARKITKASFTPLYFIFNSQIQVMINSLERSAILYAVGESCKLDRAADGESATRTSSQPPKSITTPASITPPTAVPAPRPAPPARRPPKS